MAPSKVQEVRRSRRLASMEPEEKEMTTAAVKTEKKPAFSAIGEADKIVAGTSRAYRSNKLTRENLADVIDVFVAREAALRQEVAVHKQEVADLVASQQQTAATVEADTSSAPSSPDSPVAPMRSVPSWRQLIRSIIPQLSPLGKRRLTLPEDDATPSKRVKTQKTLASPTTPAVPELRTPSQAGNQTSPRKYAGPSTKLGPAMPTSLKTISERTETSERPEPIPLEMPSAKRRMPSFTPVLESPLAQTPFRATPIRKRRSIAAVRAARLAATNSPNKEPAPWTQMADTPREPNADRRFEKMQKLRKLEENIKKLSKDEDIIEMRGHQRKRVKIEDLIKIPHNLPGDPSGCFRYFEEDSDGEIEVDINEPVRQNMFAQEAAAAEAATPRVTKPATAQTPAIAITPAQPVATPAPVTMKKTSATPRPSAAKPQPSKEALVSAASPVPAKLSKGSDTQTQGQGQKRKHGDLLAETPPQTRKSAWDFAPISSVRPKEPEFSFPHVPARKTPYVRQNDEEADKEFAAGFLAWTQQNGIEQYCRERGLLSS